MMLDPQSPTPTRKLGINCPEKCQFHPSKIGWVNANALAATRARGAGIIILRRRAEELLERPVSPTSLSRHIKHFVEVTEEGADIPQEEPYKRLTDLEGLDLIIQQGFKNHKNWKPTIRDTLEAMKLKTAMTGNSAFDDLIALMDMDEEDTDSQEAVEAVLSEEERPDEGDEELEAPLAGT